MIELRPDQGLTVLEFCVKRLATLSLAFCRMVLTIADVLVATISSAKTGGKILRLLGELADRYPDFLTGSGADIGVTAARYLDAPPTATTIAACCLLCKPGVVIPDIRPSIILRHMEKPGLYRYVYHVLARTKTIELSYDLLNSLLTKVNDPQTWALLSKIAAEIPAGFDFMLNHQHWMCQCNPKEAFAIFMLLCTDKDLRPQVYALPQYPALMALNCGLNDDAVLAALDVVMIHDNVSSAYLGQLFTVNFWGPFFDGVIRSQSWDVKKRAIALVDGFVHQGYIEHFGAFLMRLVEWIASSEIGVDIIRLMTTMSAYPQVGAKIQEAGLVQYFMDLRANEFYKQFADRLLANVNSYA
jgi:hypothetical protein